MGALLGVERSRLAALRFVAGIARLPGGAGFVRAVGVVLRRRADQVVLLATLAAVRERPARLGEDRSGRVLSVASVACYQQSQKPS